MGMPMVYGSLLRRTNINFRDGPDVITPTLAHMFPMSAKALAISPSFTEIEGRGLYSVCSNPSQSFCATNSSRARSNMQNEQAYLKQANGNVDKNLT